MLEQITYALIVVVVGIAAAFLYFWGTNWLLDKMLAPSANATGTSTVHADKLRTAIRPWLFLAPALLFMSLYLVYPVFATLWLSFFDRNGVSFVGLSNYIWLVQDPGFQQSVLNNLMWLIIVPSLATGFGLLVAVLADRLWWGQIAKSLIFMPMAISFVGRFGDLEVRL